MVHFFAVAGEGEADVGIHQRNAGELLNNVTKLRLRRFEEIAPCRHIEKQVLDREGSTRLHRHEALLFDHRAFVDNLHAHLVLFAPRLQFHLRNGCNAGQSLATKAHRADGEQVLSLADFRGGMALKAKPRIGFRHATTVVDDHNHRLSSVFHHQVYLGGTGIQSVLHQFLDG